MHLANKIFDWQAFLSFLKKKKQNKNTGACLDFIALIPSSKNYLHHQESRLKSLNGPHMPCSHKEER